MINPQTSPLEKARLKFELLLCIHLLVYCAIWSLDSNIQFRSVLVNNIPKDKLQVYPIAMHFKHYGEINNISVRPF